MSIITLDFETFYKTKGGKLHSYTLRTKTYEEYLRDPRFKVHGVGIKIDGGVTNYYYDKDELEAKLREVFFEGNEHILICHNTPFDATILVWHYKLHAKTYYCTQKMSQALYAQSSASLAALAARLFPDDDTLRKGKELADFDGVETLDDDQQAIMGGYCVNDVEITFRCFAKMYTFFPPEELELIDMTIKMFIYPAFILDRPLVEAYQKKLTDERNALIKASGLPEKLLASNVQFERYLKDHHNIDVPYKHKPTKKNFNNMTQALAKDDVEFINLQREHPELAHIWKARIATKSVGELQRCARVLSHSEISHLNPRGHLAMPLKYCGAHTKRYSGYNSINVQNFKRGSPIRFALCAEPGFSISVRDLSNIEGRMSAWFNNQDDKLDLYREGKDVYNLLGTDIYGYPVDRKLLKRDAAGNYLTKSGEITTDKDKAAKVFDVEGRVAKEAELGLGYQMGAAKFLNRLFVNGVQTDLQFATNVVKTWRRKNFKIVQGWKTCEQVIFDMARKDLVPYMWGPLRVEQQRIRLPSGLYLTYPELFYQETGERPGFYYWEGDFYKSLYGGLLMENCLAADTKVLTDSGWKNIVDVTTTDKVHDGLNFVTHGGLLYKGDKSCIQLDGVTMTPDHKVLNHAQEWTAASQNPELYRPDLRVINCNSPSPQRRKKTLLGVPLSMWTTMFSHNQRAAQTASPGKHAKLRMPNQTTTATPKESWDEQTPSVRSVAKHDGSVPFTNTSSMGKLWRARNYCSTRMAYIRTVLGGYGANLRNRLNFGSQGQQPGILSPELPMGYSSSTGTKHSQQPSSGYTGDSQSNGDQPINTVLPIQSQPVFDLVNAGPLHRFVVLGTNGPFIVHNCIQALARVVMTDMMRAIQRRFNENGWSEKTHRICLTVHDELVASHPTEDTDAVMAIMDEEMKRNPPWATDKLVLASEGGTAENYSK